MKFISKILLLFFLTNPLTTFALDYIYILNDKCINELYDLAIEDLKGTTISVNKDSRGIILRLGINNFNKTDTIFYNNLKKIEYFLAKIENPAIIEVHTGKDIVDTTQKLKNWEIATMLANKIEEYITKPSGMIEQYRINSVGYGEFLPPKNTSNNGGNILNRLDIIILCNISGE